MGSFRVPPHAAAAALLVLILARSGQPQLLSPQPVPSPQPPPRHAVRTQHFLRGRQPHTERGIQTIHSSAELLSRARAAHAAMLAEPRTATLGAPWTPVGPTQILSPVYGLLTGRVTSVAIDPADGTGNTVYLGTTGGGVWKSTNAAGAAASVSFVPLTDDLPVFAANAGSGATASLSIGAVAISNGVLLAGTGDPNDATDSYYGSGLLRSGDGGLTWTLIQGSEDGVAGNHSFFGLSFAGFAFSSASPNLIVAAVSAAAGGDLVNAADLTSSVKGLFFSTDAGLTWHMGSLFDGSQPVQTPQPSGGNQGGNAATAVVWNPLRQRFYAAVRFHGYYESTDGQTWARLAHQPGPGLTVTACPTNPGAAGSTACPIFRGALAVQPASGDLFALTVDLQNQDGGLFQDVCAATGSACGSSTVLFAKQLASTPLEVGNGSTVIPQADYNLALAAAPSGTDTIVYAGTLDLFRCTLAAGCTLRNTTNAANGCTNPAGVPPAQHSIATLATSSNPLLFLGTDGGLFRSTDGADEQAPACSADDATHFQNLNSGLGSLAEVVRFAQHPSDPETLLAGLGALGSAGTSSAPNPWPQLAAGEGGTVAIDPVNPSLWYLSSSAGVSIARCAKGSACTASDFAGPPAIGEPQVANDLSAIDAPWLLDPVLPSEVLIGTCRAWRGPASGGALWSSSNLLSRPFGAPAASACGGTPPVAFPVVRSLAAGGPVSGSTSAVNAGSEVLYAGLAGVLDGGGAGFGGHLFTTASADTASSATVWTDTAKSPVTNDPGDSGVFNPSGFDLSSLAVDPHDATGRTVYATVMGFAGNGHNAPHIYRSLDAGAHWTNISSNLPNAPANSVVVDPNDANTLYVALDTGVYVTTNVAACDAANCWSVFGSALPNAPVMELLAAAAMPTGDGRTGELRAATYGRGIWQIPLLTAISPAAPGLAVSPAALTFPAQQVGTRGPAQAVTITNTGAAPLTVTSLVETGDFLETDNCVGQPLPPGAACTAQVSFLPTAAGARSGVLTVYGNAPGGQATVALSGTGTPPAAIVLTPLSLAFGPTNIGATSSVGNITVSNTGGTLAGLQSVTITGDFRITANTCGSSLAAGTGCTVSIVFQPTSSGSRTGALTVVDDAGTQTAGLSGIGTAPATDTLSPLVLSFPAQQLNTASPTQPLTLLNSGDVALTLISAQIASGDFTVVNGCGNSLSAHATCTLLVAYAPKSLGPASGTLIVADQFRTQTVTLSGIGVAPPGVSLSPLPGLVFPPVALLTSGATQTVTLTNNGGLPLALTGVTATGDFFLQPGSNTCGLSVAPAAVCTVAVGFLPSAPGTRSGSLFFADNAGNSPQTLTLSGVGVDFSLAANGPTSATLASGASATYPLLLSSVPGVPGTSIFTCTGVPAHATCTVNPVNPSLGASTPVTVTVSTGLSSAALTPPAMPWIHSGPGIWLALLIPLGLLPLCSRRHLGSGTCLLMAAALLFVTGCGVSRTIPGNGSSSPVVFVTPAGTYTLTVSASSAGLTRTVNLTLIVQ